jgi:uncharacterized protein (DUF2235 family)
MSTARAARQLVICCDGTNNNLTGGGSDTNVVKLCQLLADDPDEDRLVLYDPGVGNPGKLPGATTWDQLRHISERIAGLAFGKGVYENMALCYRFLMQNYRAGDQIFIFGFSRGAFTARSVAGIVNQFGILRPDMDSMIPTLMHTYFAERGKSEERRKKIATQTTALFADASERYVEIQFIGVWDTVASVGMWPFGAKFASLPTVEKKRYVNVRQALALDEHRAQFSPRVYINNNGTYETERGTPSTLQQLWFRGAHCDVGGGDVVGHTAISDHALAWIMSEAVRCGLRLRAEGVPLETEALVARAVATHYPSASETIVHSELFEKPVWAIAGMTVRDNRVIKLDDGTSREITPVEHPSVAATAPPAQMEVMWQGVRKKKGLWFALGLGALMMLALGQLLSAQSTSGVWWRDIALLIQNASEYLANNWAFTRWQLFWIKDLHPSIGLAAFGSPAWAVVWDFVFIAAYAYALSWFAAAAFERHTGARRAGEAVPQWLNRLGWAFPLAVLSDVGENIASWLTIMLCRTDVTVLAFFAGFLMTIFAVLKFVGLFGVLALCLAPSSLLRKSSG